MLKIGEKYYYGGVGVVELIDVRSETSLGGLREYYVFRSPLAPASSLTYLPTDSNDLLLRVRPIYTKDEAVEIIMSAKALSGGIEEEGKSASEKLKRAIYSGGKETTVLALAIILSKRGRTGEDKRSFFTDESLIKKAERLIYSELSESLGMNESELREYIERK